MKRILSGASGVVAALAAVMSNLHPFPGPKPQNKLSKPSEPGDGTKRRVKREAIEADLRHHLQGALGDGIQTRQRLRANDRSHLKTQRANHRAYLREIAGKAPYPAAAYRAFPGFAKAA